MLIDAATGMPKGRASKELFGNPPGAFLDFGGPSPPTGYLMRNGAAVSRTTYAALFAAIGTWWGAGDGSTTFNLPDSRGVVTRGWDNGRGLDPSRTFGSYQADMFASHAHSVYDPSHAHGTNGSSGTGAEAYFAYQNSGARALNTYASGTGISIYAAGGNETRMKNVAALPIIKF
jgi:microcystin-dependent protein